MSKVYFFLKDIDTSHLKGDCREAWMPHTGDGYFDKSARQYFATKRQKRAWLIHAKMRETGELYNAKCAPNGQEGNVRKHPRQPTCWKTEVSKVRPEEI